ncbi:MAG TPA: hypothetical protein VMR98_05970, partial [Candidatus Polarisedimenticolaceae bacterium]|nr:hypothetical protein [Candidatus Polarisedimenticolaceae bacterium]
VYRSISIRTTANHIIRSGAGFRCQCLKTFSGSRIPAGHVSESSTSRKPAETVRSTVHSASSCVCCATAKAGCSGYARIAQAGRPNLISSRANAVNNPVARSRADFLCSSCCTRVFGSSRISASRPAKATASASGAAATAT